MSLTIGSAVSARARVIASTSAKDPRVVVASFCDSGLLLPSWCNRAEKFIHRGWDGEGGLRVVFRLPFDDSTFLSIVMLILAKAVAVWLYVTVRAAGHTF